MNYDKQKPLTQEEIDYINSKNNLCVMNITNYPKGFIHVEIGSPLPIKITRNEDSFWWDAGLTENNKENYWVVYPDSNSEYSFDFETKQFKDVDKAIEYVLKKYKQWLEGRLKLVETINN